MSMRHWLSSLMLLLIVGAAGPARAEDPAGEAPPPDAMAQALEQLGITEAHLGYRPKATWSRYPHPKTTPHVMPFFEDLLANPLDTYAFTRTLGNVVEDLLDAELLSGARKDKGRAETLFQLGVFLATDRRIGGFRAYSANLTPEVAKVDPLFVALVRLLERSGALVEPPKSFGKKAPGYDALASLRKQVDGVPKVLHAGLAALVLNMIESREWIERGLRDVSPEMRREVFATLPTLVADTPDGTRYYPIIDDVAKRIDEHSLWYGCLKAMQAVQDARRELGPVAAPEDGWEDNWELRLPTPWGEVLFDCNEVNQQYSWEPFLTVRCATGNNWDGPLGATSPTRSLSVALLLDSSGERHGSSFGSEVTDEPRDRAEVASGVLGCGIVYASGNEHQYWKTSDWGLGAGLFGLGALIDEGGDDVYRMATMGQGAALFGAGLLLDAGGDDEYRLLEGDGQGFGGPGGIGILADRRGNDTYYAEPDASKAGRADYHSQDKVAVSNAQGVGSGRRGDGSDGHSWAGGLGALIDVDGHDHYKAGNFSQGLGYWYGTGLLWDGAGDDKYESVYFTQGSGAHFAVGALIDESGNDVHRLGENAGAAFGFGWDVVNAFLIDRGVGNDTYEALIISSGLAEVRSNAFLLDEGGDDTYVLRAKTRGFGDVDDRASYTTPHRFSPFNFELGQVGMLLDLGGADKYLRVDKDGARSPDPKAGDNKSWNVRARKAGERHGPNVSIGLDMKTGRLGFLEPWPARKPPADMTPRDDDD